MRRRRWCTLTAVVAAMAIVVMSTAAGAAAQGIRLQLRPHAGDTIVMRIDQRTETTASGRSTMTKAGASARVTTLTIFSRAIVEDALGADATILAITDSVVVGAEDEGGKGAAATPRRYAYGVRLHVRVSPDGAMRLADDKTAHGVPGDFSLSMVAATFPSEVVAVGALWTRDIAIPSTPPDLGAALFGRVAATFTLDSVSRGGALAYLSICGDLRPGPGASMPGAVVVESGSLAGVMVIDQSRGWVAASSFVITAVSTVTPLAPGGATSRFQTRVTQSMRTMDKR